MGLSLIEELSKIVAEGKKEVERILERISSPHKLTLQTNEFVFPVKINQVFLEDKPLISSRRLGNTWANNNLGLRGYLIGVNKDCIQKLVVSR